MSTWPKIDEPDPLYMHDDGVMPGDMFCDQDAPASGWQCTRAAGHEVPHVTCEENGATIEAWAVLCEACGGLAS